jgi:hypothetical protein
LPNDYLQYLFFGSPVGVNSPCKKKEKGWFPWCKAQEYEIMVKHYPSALANFDTNYIIFKNVEICKNYFLQIKKLL